MQNDKHIPNGIENSLGDRSEETVSIGHGMTFKYMTRIFRENGLEIDENKIKFLWLVNENNVYKIRNYSF